MNLKNEIKTKILASGFSEVRFLQSSDPENSIIIAAFPYSVNKKYTEKAVKISPFAQKNHYSEAVNRLKKVALSLREKTSLKKKDIRIFCNSQLEEKWFAASSGLGFYGRNSLIITKESGSRVILAGMVLPLSFQIDKELTNGTIPGALCGSCRNCVSSCPTSSIKNRGIIDRDTCLQSLATDNRILPESIMEKWGNRLYGCSICQDCCPFNKNLINCQDGVTIRGELGDSVPYELILTADDSRLKEYFRGTALSMSWINFDLLRRNALISAASEKDESLISLISQYENHDSIGYAARWSLKKMTRQAKEAPDKSARKSPNSIILP